MGGWAIWFSPQVLFNLPPGPKIPAVTRREKEKIPRTTTVRHRQMELKMLPREKKRETDSAKQRLNERTEFRGTLSRNSRL